MYRIIKLNTNSPRYFHYIPMTKDEYIFIWELDSMKATLFESKTKALEKIWLCGLYIVLQYIATKHLKSYIVD